MLLFYNSRLQSAWRCYRLKKIPSEKWESFSCCRLRCAVTNSGTPPVEASGGVCWLALHWPIIAFTVVQSEERRKVKLQISMNLHGISNW